MKTKERIQKLVEDGIIAMPGWTKMTKQEFVERLCMIVARPNKFRDSLLKQFLLQM